MSLKLPALRAFASAVEEGSIRAAARRLGVSQPAVTKMIRELEVELSARLLTRTVAGVVPTAQGKALHARVVNVGRELNAAVDEIHQLGGTFSGELRIGAVPLAVMLLLPEALRTFAKEFPEVTLRPSEELFFAQLQKLRADEVDVAVCGVPEGLRSGDFVVEPLMSATAVVVVARHSRHARARSLRQLADAKWVYSGAPGPSGYVPLMFARHGLPPPPVGAIVNSTLTLLAMLSGGDMVGLMPLQFASNPLLAPLLSVVPVEEEGVRMELAAIVRADAVVSPLIRHFIAHLHRAAHQLG